MDDLVERIIATDRTDEWIKASLEPKRSWTVPAQAGGADSLGDALLAKFCEALGIVKMPPKKAKQWAKQLSKIARDMGANREQALEALEALLEPDGLLQWMKAPHPFKTAFVDTFEVALAQAVSGALEEQAAGWYAEYQQYIER